MKRIFALMLALLMVFALVSCDDKEEEEESDFDITVSDNELVFKPQSDYADAFYYERTCRLSVEV